MEKCRRSHCKRRGNIKKNVGENKNKNSLQAKENGMNGQTGKPVNRWLIILTFRSIHPAGVMSLQQLAACRECGWPNVCANPLLRTVQVSACACDPDQAKSGPEDPEPSRAKPVELEPCQAPLLFLLFLFVLTTHPCGAKPSLVEIEK